MVQCAVSFEGTKPDTFLCDSARNDCYYLEPSAELPEDAPPSAGYEAAGWWDVVMGFVAAGIVC